MSIFLTFLKFHFSDVKSILFYMHNIQKNLLWLNLPKTYQRENIRFFDKNHGLTTLKNFDCLNFFKTSLFRSRKLSFLLRTSKNKLFLLNLSKKYPWENIGIVDKNNGVTPLENLDFLDFFKTLLFSYKKHSFLSRMSNKNLFWLNLSTNYPEENTRFLTKRMD